MLAGLCNVIAGFLLSRFRHAVGAAADATHILDPSRVRVIAVRAPQRDSEGKHKVVMLTGAGAELPVTGICHVSAKVLKLSNKRRGFVQIFVYLKSTIVEPRCCTPFRNAA